MNKDRTVRQKKVLPILKKILSIVLCITLVTSCIPITSLIANAADSEGVEILNGNGEKVADEPTVNDWKKFFGPQVHDTSGAGTVWTDKSVFTSVADYVAATDEVERNNFGLVMDDEDNNFLVSLSTIASSKSVEGYSTLPTDTILVLDLSASMEDNNQAVGAMVQSANDAIVKLQELNAYNRVGVVAYSGNSDFAYSETDTAEIILPLGRYTPGLAGNNRSAYLVSSWTTRSGRDTTSHTGVKVANGVTGTVADGITDTINTNNQKDADGGTYIQNGLYKAYQQFNAVTDTTVDEGMQAGTSRVPVMVLLSDGAPTTATTSYTNVGRSDSGDGDSDYATPGIAFLTQLTASWVREKVADKYGTNALFYTLGLNVQDNDAAESVLDPSNNTATDGYWSTYLGLANNQNMTVTIREQWGDDETRRINYTDSVTWTKYGENYVTEYFPASNAAGLINAFGAIVDQIIVQSLYYPTYVEAGNTIDHSGFLDFEDYIGKNMEVKSIKGIQLGDTLYTGQTLARMIYEGGMGTEDNPTDAGNNLVWSVQQRLGIDTVTEARTVIGQAYANGQLYYNPETGEFSNYIGWYADEDGKFVSFWDGKDASVDAVPETIKDKTVFAIKSYGYYDAVGVGHRKTDMMYATIQVRTTVKETDVDASEIGDVRLIGRLPASLIPLVEYNIDLNGTDPMNPATMTIEGAESPSRLIYEVGLDSDVDLLELANTAADSLDKETGKYVFYTNEWKSILDEKGNIVDFSYYTNKNTTSYFSPSLENERYYYNVDTPIYTDENGTLYDDEKTPDPKGKYYHRMIIYKTQNNGEVTAEWFYEPISEHVLEHDGDLEKRTDADGNTYWVVLKGTIHHYYGDYIVEKNGGNHTGTVHVSDMPFVHDVTVSITPDEFHVDSYLGNNGRLTIDPYEGIKISKIVDDTIADKSGEYIFTVTASNDNFSAECIVIYEDAAGNRKEETVQFTNGTATVTLSHGEAVYILGEAMEGRTFTIIEEEGEGYQVGSVSVNGEVVTGDTAEVTVVNNSIATADFVNTQIVNGDVVIGKRVVSTFASHEGKEFEFTVTISGNMLSEGDTFATVKSNGTAGANMQIGKNTVILKHGEYITIKDLPEGVTVSVTEDDYKDKGFTTESSVDEANVVAGKTQYIVFTNTYDAADSDPFRTVITVNKNLDVPEGASWEGKFQFQLERYNGTEYVKVGEAEMNYSTETETNAVALNLENEVYKSVGTYYYRVVEISNDTNVQKGIIYDVTPAYFSVVVSDDGEGKLKVSDVIEGSGASVSNPANNTWNVATTFDNTYNANGGAEAIINILKTIDGSAGNVTIPPSGFTFALYDATDTEFSTPIAEVVTGADGKAEISLTYGEGDINKQHYYILKEVVGGKDVEGTIEYDDTKYEIKVSVSNASGVYSVSIKVDDGESNTATSAGSSSIAVVRTGDLSFVNKYTPNPVKLRPAISGNKTLTGRAQEKGEFTFDLYKTEADFKVGDNATAIDSASAPAASADVASVFNFDELTYDKADTYYYVVKEKLPEGVTVDNNKLNGVTYDTSEYRITVNVTADNNAGTLSATAVITKNGTTVSAITFNNTYVPDSTEVVIGGSKVLTGGIRKLQARAFEFELLYKDEVIRTAYNGVPVEEDEEEKAYFDFAPITLDTEGVYEYTVREKLPEGVNKDNNTLNGVSYDIRSYIVEVTIDDNGLGELVKSYKYFVVDENGNKNEIVENEIEFVNSYTVAPTYVDLSGSKNLEGDVLSKYSEDNDNAFYYELYLARWDSDNKVIIQDKLIATTTDNGTGSYSFNYNNGEIKELQFDSIGGYYFIIKELVPDNTDPLMIYDTSEYHVEVDVVDNLAGNLVATTRITKVDAEGNQTIITDNDGSGHVRDDIDFYNVFEEEPIPVNINGEKKYNIDLPEGKFTFELYQALKDADGNINAVGEPVLETQNAADGTFKFEEYTDADGKRITSYITFSEDGTYYFVVKEQLPEGVTEDNKTLAGITYDTNAYTITVVVSEGEDDTGRAVLSAKVSVDGEANGNITFENKYDASAEKGVVITGEKMLNGKTLTDNEFTFELYDATLGKDGTVSYEGEPRDTTTNKGKAITFKEIKYTSLEDAKTHYYVVKEQIPEGADKDNKFESVTYDDTAYLVTVQVVDNGDGTFIVGDLIYQVIGAGNKVSAEDGKTVDTVTFVNNYKADPTPEPKPEEPSSPTTGDNSRGVTWSVLLAVSFGGICVWYGYDRKTRKKEE